MIDLFLAHTHYLPEGLLADQGLHLGAVLVPEFYPDLVHSYYGEIEYFTSVPEFTDYFHKWIQGRGPFRFSLENIRMLPSISQLSAFKELGVICLQIYHHSDNLFFSLSSGLTEEGYRLLRVMQEEDMILDLSHLHDHWIRKILAVYAGKIMVSHCSLSSMLDHPEQRSNCISLDTVAALAKRQALVGISFVNDTVSRDPYEQDSEQVYQDIVRLIIFLNRNFGPGQLCFGPDYFDFAYYSHVFKKRLFIPQMFLSSAGFVRLYSDLRKHLMSDSDVKAVFWDNAAHFFDCDY